MPAPIAASQPRPIPASALVASLALAATIVPPPGLAAAAEIEASSVVVEALVYPSGALVTRAAAFAAPAGRHEVVVTDLPLGLDERSLRVAGAAQGGAFEILGIAYKRRQPRVEPLSEPERQALLDRIEEKEWELREAADAVAEARARVEYMQAFRAATVGQGPIFGRGEPGREGGGRRGGLFAASESWQAGWALIAVESGAARRALRDAERLQGDVAEMLAKLRDELDQAGPPPPARNVLTVSIDAPEGVAEGSLSVEYLAASARWAPLYDLKLGTDHETEPGLKGSLELSRLATVTQGTGEDWRTVRLSLSTARPSGRVAAQPPRPKHATLAPLTPPALSRSGAEVLADGLISDEEGETRRLRSAFNRAEAPQPAPMTAQSLSPQAPREASAASALAAYSGAGVVYEIRESVDIPGDGEQRQVLIGVETAEVELVARATPALEKTAYLYAMRRNGEAPLLPGRAAIYRDGVFHGQFDLAYVAPGADSALPFGRLDGVTVDHVTRTKTTGEEGLFSTSNREQSRFEISAKNNGETPRRITLLDSMPYSETEEIEIAFMGRAAPTERNVEGKRGVVAWTFDLAPGAERRIPFGYDINWPEGREMRIRAGR